MQKNHSFQELTDDQLDQVTGGMDTSTQTQTTVPGLNLPQLPLGLGLGLGLDLQTPVGGVKLGLGANTKLGL